MKKSSLYYAKFIVFLLVGILMSGCNSDTTCDQNEPLVIDFKLDIVEGKKRLINLTEPACQVKKVKWDFDSDGIHESEDLSPLIPDDFNLNKVTLMINGLSEITKTLTDVTVPLELVVDFLAPTTAKVGEEIALTNLSEPQSLVKDINWSFGDDLSNTDNKSEVYHAYNKPGKYKIELCLNYNVCKTHEITISGKPKKIAATENLPASINPPKKVDRVTSSNVSSSKPSYQEVETKSYQEVETKSYPSVQSYPEVSQPSATSPPKVVEAEIKKVPIYTVRIDMPVTAEVDQNITIQDNSTIMNGSIDTYNWSIDGNSKTGKSINYTFNEPGDFQVQLCLNGTGNCAKRTIRVKEKFIPPVYQVDFNLPKSILEGEQIELISLSTANVDIKTYTWTIEGQTKSGSTVSHVFSNSGSQKIKLCIDNRDCKTKRIKVEKKKIIEPEPVKVAIKEVDPVKEEMTEKVEETKIVESTKETTSEVIAAVAVTKELTPSESTTEYEKPSTEPSSNSFASSKKIETSVPSKPVVEKKPPPKSPKKETKKSIIIPVDDDFYATNSSTKRPAFNDCSEGGWISGSTIRFTPKQKISLQKAVVYANGNGKIEFKLGYNHNGIVEEIPLTRNVNAGRSELLLSKFYLTLYPGITYTLVLSSKTDQLKIRNISPCGDSDKGDNRLGIEHKSGYCLFELQYKY